MLGQSALNPVFSVNLLNSLKIDWINQSVLDQCFPPAHGLTFRILAKSRFFTRDNIMPFHHAKTANAPCDLVHRFILQRVEGCIVHG